MYLLCFVSRYIPVGTQAFVSGSTGSKCLCCPYGYHIDLDFVRYCEAVAAGSAGDRSSIERRKKRERRRQCQSMEVLLGLVIDRFNPAIKFLCPRFERAFPASIILNIISNVSNGTGLRYAIIESCSIHFHTLYFIQGHEN